MPTFLKICQVSGLNVVSFDEFFLTKFQVSCQKKTTAGFGPKYIPSPPQKQAELPYRLLQNMRWRERISQAKFHQTESFAKEYKSNKHKVVKMATLVEGDPKAPFSIATTPRCRGGRYSFSGRFHFTLDAHLMMLNAKQVGIKYHFLSL